MAIHLRQLGRSPTEVAFGIDGITGDRQTLVYIPEKREYVTLKNTVLQGYIDRYTAPEATNGAITLYFSSAIAADFPVWQVMVQNCVGANVTASSQIVLCTQFAYDGPQTKKKGAPIDLTAADMNRLSLFARQLERTYSGENKAQYYEVKKGDPINYEHIREVARGLYNAMTGGNDWNDRGWVNQMCERLETLKDAESISDWQPEAEVYNLLCSAINDLNFETSIYG